MSLVMVRCILIIGRRMRTSQCRFMLVCYFFIVNMFENCLSFFPLKGWVLLPFLPYACLSNSDFVLTDVDYKMMEDAQQNRNRVRLSAVQGYMTNFYRLLPMLLTYIISCRMSSDLMFANMIRKYGSYVARHPIMVLASSLAIVLLLCLGLIQFKVETRPEKVNIT